MLWLNKDKKSEGIEWKIQTLNDSGDIVEKENNMALKDWMI